MYNIAHANRPTAIRLWKSRAGEKLTVWCIVVHSLLPLHNPPSDSDGGT